MRQHKWTRRLFALACLAAVPVQAMAQSPVTVVIGYGPGGPLDIMARLIQSALSSELGAPVVIKNVPGANAALGAMEVIRSRPDGTTLLFTTGTSLTLSPHTRPTPFRQKDLLPVCQISNAPVMLMASPGSGLRSLDDVAVRAREQPDAFPYGTTGPGTTGHILMLQLGRLMGWQANQIPYRSAGEIVQGLAAGHIATYIDQSNLVRQYRLTPLLVFSEQRRPEFPDVPTARELGHDIVFSLWSGFYAPALTPPDVLDRLDAACGRVLRRQDVADAFQRTDMPIHWRARNEFAPFHQEEYLRFERLSQSLGLIAEQ